MIFKDGEKSRRDTHAKKLAKQMAPTEKNAAPT